MVPTARLLLFFSCAVSFFLGRLASTLLQVTVEMIDPAASHSAALPLNSSKSSSLQQQVLDQHAFQHFLYKSQHPHDCTMTRYLLRDGDAPKDGFASEFQYMARLLQVAVSTRRVLWISPDWTSAYAPSLCHGWTCLFSAPTNCTANPQQAQRRLHGKVENSNETSVHFHSTTSMYLESLGFPLTYAVLLKIPRSSSNVFDPLSYGTQRLLSAPRTFPLSKSTRVMDVMTHWERIYGRYWIRSQIVHYLWRPSTYYLADYLQQQMATSELVRNSSVRYIGIHIRYTDNIPDFQNSFGRNATWTRQFQRSWKICEQLHKAQPNLAHIYLATDNAHVLLEWMKQSRDSHWTIWSQSNAQRSTTQQRTWFSQGRRSQGGAMATDVEFLRRADYLIGSFQSNVYRLATELNTAYHVSRHSVHQPRHFALDVEWYEDP